MARSVEAAQGADLALFVCDGSRPLEPEDREAMEAASHARHTICILNKQDLPCQVERSSLPFETILPVSAKAGTGLEALTPVLEALFGPGLPVMVPFSPMPARRTPSAGRWNPSAGPKRGWPPDLPPMRSLPMWKRRWRPWESSAAEPSGRTSPTGFFERFCVGK